MRRMSADPRMRKVTAGVECPSILYNGEWKHLSARPGRMAEIVDTQVMAPSWSRSGWLERNITVGIRKPLAASNLHDGLRARCPLYPRKRTLLQQPLA